MYLNNLFIFSEVGNFYFILTGVKNKFFFFVRTKDEQIFFSTYFCKPTSTAVNFDDNKSNSVGSLVM